LGNEAEFPGYFDQSRTFRGLVVSQEIRNPSKLGVDEMFFITREGMKAAKVSRLRPATQKQRTLIDKLATVAKARDVVKYSKADNPAEMSDFMHYVLLMKGLILGDTANPHLEIQRYVTFGGQGLSSLHLKVIKKFYDKWMAFEWRWQGGRHALATFVCDDESVDNSFATSGMDCQIWKRYFRLDLRSSLTSRWEELMGNGCLIYGRWRRRIMSPFTTLSS
jgi:hypothetical protein